MGIRVETVCCDLCGSTEHQILPYGGYCVDETLLDLVRCAHCGLRFVNPRPTQDYLLSLYSEKFFVDPLYWSGALESGTYFDNVEGRQVYYNKVASDFHAMVTRFVRPPGTLLDVGCAGGLLMKELENLGWTAHGVDVSDSATSFARERLGLNVITGTVADANFQNGQFDVVIVKDVLEHVESPRALLRETKRILAPNGVAVIHVPTDYTTLFQKTLDVRSWVIVRAMDKQPFRRSEFAPPHLYHFTHQIFRRYAWQTGFRLVESFASSPVSPAGTGSPNAANLRESLKRWLFKGSDLLGRRFNRGMETTFLIRTSGRAALGSPN